MSVFRKPVPVSPRPGRSGRSLSILALPVLGLTVTASAPLTAPTIRATPVALDRSDPARVRVAGLRYLGGWELSSSDLNFGGLSAMVWRDGRLIAVSDAGTVFGIGFVRGVPVGRVVGPLPDGPGDPARKSDRDSEAMTIDPATGRIWVGFEGQNAVWRYGAGFVHAEANAKAPAMAKWPANGGSEAMIRLADGRFLVFSEEARGPEKSTALLIFPTDPTMPGAPPTLAGYRAPPGYEVTDVTRLADGRLLVLQRRVSLMQGLTAVVSILDPAAIRPGHAVTGRLVAELLPPLTVDNMEAIATSQENDRTVVWIASDDNFSPLQRTLLLKFALEEPSR